MTQDFVINLAIRALTQVLMISAPLVGLGLLVGLAISVFQATTQIQEQTLTFVPKLLVTIGAIVIFGRWMLVMLMDYTTSLLGNLHVLIR